MSKELEREEKIGEGGNAVRLNTAQEVKGRNLKIVWKKTVVARCLD